MNSELKQRLQAVVPAQQIRESEPMAAHTSFRTGGAADLFVRILRREELQGAVQLLRSLGEPYFILGRGSNLLVGDRGFRGVVLSLVPAPEQESELTAITVEGTHICAGAGATLQRLSLTARDHALTGLEFACGIPGSVGGAMVMNAGAYDGEMKNVVESVDLLLEDGSLQTFTGEQMQFSYRHSILKENGAIALSARFSLQPGEREAITAKIADFAQRRKDKQPLEYPSAGSTFKRPTGYFAGKLIQDAGLRGFAIGGAQVSEKHCGFVINRDHATAADVRAVIEAVQKRVLESSGVQLEREVIFLGDF